MKMGLVEFNLEDIDYNARAAGVFHSLHTMLAYGGMKTYIVFKDKENMLNFHKGIEKLLQALKVNYTSDLSGIYFDNNSEFIYCTRFNKKEIIKEDVHKDDFSKALDILIKGAN